MKVKDLNSNGKTMHVFWCEPCNTHHSVNESWTFNGNYESPTFSPSILVRSTMMTEKGLSDYEEWCKAGHPGRNGEPFDYVQTICHSFVTDGKIKYLSDCTHALAGKTVELEECDW